MSIFKQVSSHPFKSFISLLIFLSILFSIKSYNSLSTEIQTLSSDINVLQTDLDVLSTAIGNLALDYSEKNPTATGTAETGNSFFIDPNNGSPNNDGSIEYPWKSLNDVLISGYIESTELNPLDDEEDTFITINEGAPIKAGDTIYLMSGDYGKLIIAGYFNDSPITIKAYHGQYPIFDSIEIDHWESWILEGLNPK